MRLNLVGPVVLALLAVAGCGGGKVAAGTTSAVQTSAPSAGPALGSVPPSAGPTTSEVHSSGGPAVGSEGTAAGLPSAPAATGGAASLPSPAVATTGRNVPPGATVPVMPAVARQHTQLGARMFAVYMVSALNWAYSTNDPTLFEQGTDPICSPCVGLINDFKKARRDGAYFVGGHLTIKTVADEVPPRRANGSTNSVNVTVQIEALRYVSPGETNASDKPYSQASTFFMKWNNGWKLVNFANAAKAGGAK